MIERIDRDDFQLMEHGCRIEIAPPPGQPVDDLWARAFAAHEEGISQVLCEHGVRHHVVVASPERPSDSAGVPGDAEDSSAVWERVLGELRHQMTRATFDTLLRDSRLVDRAEDTLIVAVSNTQAKAWLETKLLPVVTRTLARLCERALDVQFVVPESVVTNQEGHL